MIRNVVFDIGGVLLRLRYQPFIEYLGGAGIDMTNLPRWLEQVDLAAHERGEITDVNSFLDALEEATAAEHGMAILEEVQGILVCSSGLGDGVYSVSVRKGAGDAIDGVKVDFTPSAAAMSLLYDLG